MLTTEESKRFKVARWVAAGVALALLILLPQPGVQTAVSEAAEAYGSPAAGTAILSSKILTTAILSVVSFVVTAGLGLTKKLLAKWMPSGEKPPGPGVVANVSVAEESLRPVSEDEWRQIESKAAESAAESCVLNRLRAGDTAGLKAAEDTYYAVTGKERGGATALVAADESPKA